MAGATAPAVFLWDLPSNSSQEGHCSRDRGSRHTGPEAGALTSKIGGSPRQTPEPLNPAPSLLYLGPKRARCSDSGGTGSRDRTCPLSPPDGRAFGHRRPQVPPRLRRRRDNSRRLPEPGMGAGPRRVRASTICSARFPVDSTRRRSPRNCRARHENQTRWPRLVLGPRRCRHCVPGRSQSVWTAPERTNRRTRQWRHR